MILSAVALALPSRLVSNGDVVDEVARHSAGELGDELDTALTTVRRLLRRSGAETRYWLGGSESPMSLVHDAVERVLRDAGVARDDIDLLVYIGVDRVLIEPANAYLIAREIQASRAECFDVLDACNGWVRAMQILDAMSRTGAFRNALVVSAEFNISSGAPGYPGIFSLGSTDDLGWKFAGLTLGEAATATLIRAGGDRPWLFRSESRPDLVDLCSVVVSDPDRYTSSGRVGRAGRNLVASYGSDLFRAAQPQIRLLLDERGAGDDVRAIFVHAASERPWSALATEHGIAGIIHNVYPHAGNLVSSSVPAAIARALRDGSVQRGDKVQALVGSAGMVFSLATFWL